MEERTDLEWEMGKGTLLELSKKCSQLPKSDPQYIELIPSQCGFGSCGTCKTKFKGKVSYIKQPGYMQLKEDECLPCICMPDGDVVLIRN